MTFSKNSSYLLKKINKEELNSFLKKQEQNEFLQSFEWIKFQSDFFKQKFYSFAVVEGDKILAIFNFVKKKLFLQKAYYYAPRLVFDKSLIASKRKEVFNFFLQSINKQATEDNIIFFRFEFAFEEDEEVLQKFRKTINLQPAKTLILDLRKGEDDLLADMYQKTRYNIRLASKKGVKVKELKADNFEDFWKLMKQTGQRDGFSLHQKNYYKEMLKIKGELKMHLFVAYYEETILAGAILACFGDTCVYLHGASSNTMRNLMAPYLLQWEMIKFAKKNNFSYYDFFGIDEEKWPGVTRFKKGFAYRNFEKSVKKYSKTYDFVFSEFWYFVYKILRYFRRKIIF